MLRHRKELAFWVTKFIGYHFLKLHTILVLLCKSVWKSSCTAMALCDPIFEFCCHVIWGFWCLTLKVWQVQRFIVALLELLSFSSVTTMIFSYSLCSLEPVPHNVSVFLCILPWQGTVGVRNFLQIHFWQQSFAWQIFCPSMAGWTLYSAVYIAQVHADHPHCMSNKRGDCKRFGSDSHGNNAAVMGDIMLLHGGTQ